MKVRMRPMFAPVDDHAGPDDVEAKIRIAMKKAKEEGRRAATETFEDLIQDAGFQTVDEFKAAMKAMKRDDSKDQVKPGKNLEFVSMPGKTEAEFAAEKAASEKAAADKVAAEAKTKELNELKLQMAYSGIRVEDLDWAANRFLAKKGDLPPSGVAAFTVDTFVTELRTATPTVFRDPPAANPPASNQPPAATPPTGTPPTGTPPVPGATGNRNTPPPAQGTPPEFNALKATPEQNRARMAEILAGPGN